MRRTNLAVIVLLLLALAGCEAMGALQGGASDNGGHARVKMGVPF